MVSYNEYSDYDSMSSSGIFAENDLHPDHGTWIKSAFLVTLGEEFTSYTDMLEYILADEEFTSGGEAELNDAYSEMISDAGSSEESIFRILNSLLSLTPLARSLLSTIQNLSSSNRINPCLTCLDVLTLPIQVVLRPLRWMPTALA